MSPERGQIQEQILERILGQLIYDPTEGVRAAACVWLVSLCRFTGRQPRLLARLADIQEAFSSLLGDSSEIAQVRTHAPSPQCLIWVMHYEKDWNVQKRVAFVVQT